MDKILEQFKKLHNEYLYADYKISEAAEYIGVSRRTIERWLKGKTTPTPNKLDKLQKFLCSREI